MANLNYPSFGLFFDLFKRHIHHFIFALTILSLAALIAWWTVFIHNSILIQHNSQLEKLGFELNSISRELGNGNTPPTPGILEVDKRFEILMCSADDQTIVRRLEPRWPDLCVRPREVVLERIESKYKRMHFMLIGEAGFFVMIILVSSFFLYRFIQLERRTALEVRRFWERSAHEIKTPITGIKAFLQNLKSHTYDTEELAPYVDLALKQVANQEQLADNIMSGYQLKLKDISTKLTNFELKTFLTEYFEKSPLQFINARVRLKFQNRRDIFVKADRTNLKVVLDNIVDNVIKYSMPDLILTVDINTGKKKAIVTIADNGPGMSPEKMRNALSAFKHSDEDLPVKRRGAGFGLYISRQLTHHMGGDFRISSEGHGKGSQFLITLNMAAGNDL